MNRGILALTQYFLPRVAIDLGTVNTLIAIRGKGVVLNEPSVIAVSVKDQSEVLAVGKDAVCMLDDMPGKIRLLYPIRDGVVADKKTCEAMLKLYLQRVLPHTALSGVQLTLCLPMCVSGMERRAVREAAIGAGIREARIMEEALAAAIGAHLPVYEPYGSMIVDIGGGTTDVAVVSLGGIAAWESVRTAGLHIDAALMDYIDKEYGLLIGRRSAEEIKINSGSIAVNNALRMQVYGREKKGGLPKSVEISAQEISFAMEPAMHTIVDAVKRTLSQTPPELAGDISQSGIMLCGGGAMLRGLDKLLQSETGVPVYVAQDPMLCVAMGALRAEYLQIKEKSERISYGTVQID